MLAGGSLCEANGTRQPTTAAKAHSKQIRKARRGERRGRTAASKPTDHVGKTKPKPKAKTGTGKPAAKRPAAKRPPPKGPRPPKAR